MATNKNREALIKDLRWLAARRGYTSAIKAANMLEADANMLEADANLRIELAKRTVERNIAISMVARMLDEPQEAVHDVQWGVEWGQNGESSCVSIIKKHSDGSFEIVATEFEPQRKTHGLALT